MDPWFSHGMDGILRQRSWKLSGILNGIDVVSYDPATDKDIYAPFTAEDLSDVYKRQLWTSATRPVSALLWIGCLPIFPEMNSGLPDLTEPLAMNMQIPEKGSIRTGVRGYLTTAAMKS